MRLNQFGNYTGELSLTKVELAYLYQLLKIAAEHLDIDPTKKDWELSEDDQGKLKLLREFNAFHVSADVPFNDPIPNIKAR